MKFWKVVLWLVLVLQIPFVYSLCETWQLKRYLEKLPRKEIPAPPFRDVRGSIHIHSAAGGHSTGTYPEIIAVAKGLGYGYLFLTEHPKQQPLFEQITDSGIVVVYGSEEELNPSTRVLLSPGSEVLILTDLQGEEIPTEVTGYEVYNLHENGEKKNTLWNWAKFLYHIPLWQDLFYFQVWEIDWRRLEAWDKQIATRRLAGTAGNDAHQNVGLVLQTTSGTRILSVMLDPYEYSLKFVTNHVVLSPESEVTVRTILDALRTGSCYICFEGIADPTGFSFHAEKDGKSFPMGSEVAAGSDLVFQSPVPARFLLRSPNGVAAELEGSRFVWSPPQSGPYRLEVYLLDPPGLLADKPWIVSNPIYVR